MQLEAVVQAIHRNTLAMREKLIMIIVSRESYVDINFVQLVLRKARLSIYIIIRNCDAFISKLKIRCDREDNFD